MNNKHFHLHDIKSTIFEVANLISIVQLQYTTLDYQAANDSEHIDYCGVIELGPVI